MNIPRGSPWMAGSTSHTPAIRSDSVTFAMGSLHIHLAVVTHHQPQRPGPGLGAGDRGLPPDEGVLEARDVHDAAAGHDHGVLDLGVRHLAVLADRGKRSHKAVG